MARSRLAFAGSLTFVLVVLVAWTPPARSQETKAAAKAEPSIAAKPGEWRYLNGDPLSTRYAPLDQIAFAHSKPSADHESSSIQSHRNAL